VLVDDVAEPLLLGAAEGTKRQGHREREPSPVKPRREIRAQPPREREPALDPERFSPESLGDGGFGELILVAQGGDDAGFVHRAGGFRGSVGVEKSSLHRREGLDRLDDDGDFGAPLRAPEGQSLEAVEDLEGAVPRGGDAKRQRRQIAAIGSLAAQRRERCAKPVDRDGDHGVAPGSGRSW
jgi:hypothetical protein